MSVIKNEIRIFLASLMFLTRIPVLQNNPVDLNKASRYFPLVGIIVGLIGLFVYTISHLLFKDATIASILSLAATLLTTGAFHEDGLADVADGFGGGWTKIRILEIMKDSRVGAYGVITLIVIIGLKISLVAKIAGLFNSYRFALILITAHSISRIMPMFLLRFLSYSRDDNTAKVKPQVKHITIPEFTFALISGLAPLIILSFYYTPYVCLSLIPCGLITLYLARYFNKWINGYTGDCLGATQQLNEIVFYLSMLAIWNYSL
jgi:adenosylcobinamide-GDP ribazoletransferase